MVISSVNLNSMCMSLIDIILIKLTVVSEVVHFSFYLLDDNVCPTSLTKIAKFKILAVRILSPILLVVIKHKTNSFIKGVAMLKNSCIICDWWLHW